MKKPRKGNSGNRSKQAASPKKTPLGRTFQTNDNCFDGQGNAPPKARRVVVVEVNHNNEYGVVGLTTQKSKKVTELPNYPSKKGEKTHYKHFLEVRDDKGQPIVKGAKFRENHKNNDVPPSDVDNIKKELYDKSTPTHQRNIKNRGWLNKRPKK